MHDETTGLSFTLTLNEGRVYVSLSLIAVRCKKGTEYAHTARKAAHTAKWSRLRGGGAWERVGGGRRESYSKTAVCLGQESLCVLGTTSPSFGATAQFRAREKHLNFTEIGIRLPDGVRMNYELDTNRHQLFGITASKALHREGDELVLSESRVRYSPGGAKKPSVQVKDGPLSPSFGETSVLSLLEERQPLMFSDWVSRLHLDPEKDFRHSNLSGVDFGEVDLRDYDLTGANLDFITYRDRLKSGGFGPAMKRLPPGEFWMGVEFPEEEEKRRDGTFRYAPRQHVQIATGFEMGVYAVTFEEYDRYCEATGEKAPEDEGWGRGRRPVMNVSWEEATAYSAWLSEETGQPYRLPTESEWEYAARAGTETRYWYGDEADATKMNVEKSKKKQTVEVGGYPANPWGLYEVHGNVLEWTTTTAERGEHRVLRGGSWSNDASFARSAYRNHYRPASRNIRIGFRLARGQSSQ